jgi:serine/threonine protein kinase
MTIFTYTVSRSGKFTHKPAKQLPQSKSSAFKKITPNNCISFQIGSRVGAGANGTVYNAQYLRSYSSISTETNFVIKQGRIPKSALHNLQAERDFFIRANNATAVLSFIEELDKHEMPTGYIHYTLLMEKLPGKTYLAWINENQHNPITCLSITLAVLKKLKHLHEELGIIHGDLSAANIMIETIKSADGTTSYNVRFIDFFFACLNSQLENPPLANEKLEATTTRPIYFTPDRRVISEHPKGRIPRRPGIPFDDIYALNCWGQTHSSHLRHAFNYSRMVAKTYGHKALFDMIKGDTCNEFITLLNEELNTVRKNAAAKAVALQIARFLELGLDKSVLTRTPASSHAATQQQTTKIPTLSMDNIRNGAPTLWQKSKKRKKVAEKALVLTKPPKPLTLR